MQYGESIAEKSTAKAIASGIPLLFQKVSDQSEQFRVKAIRHYLHYHLRDTSRIESAKRILRLSMNYVENTSNDSIETSDSRVLEIAELIGLRVDADSMSRGDFLHNVFIGLEQVRDRLSAMVKSRSERNILDLLNIIEEDRLSKRSCLNKSVDDLIISLISAFEPERILNTVDEDEASREWLKQNSLYDELKNKYENIQKYRESGKFLRDFWIMNNQNSKRRI